MTRAFIITPLLLLPLLQLAACSSTPDKAPEPAVLVSVARAAQGQVGEQITLYGVVEAGSESELTLSAPSEAIVRAIASPAGSAVGANSVVVELMPSPQSALDRTKAASDAAAADSAYARAQRLKADGLLGNGEVDAARAVAQAADATRNSLGQRAGSLRLHARTSGVVNAILVKPGDLVAAGAPIARIAKGGDTRVRFGVDPGLARKIAQGSSLVIQPMGGGMELSLGVTGVDSVVDPVTRLAAVFANIPASARLAVGESIKGVLSVRGAAASDGITIPYAAVQDEGGVPFVFVVVNGVAHKHEVKLGSQGGDTVLVLAGVAAGDMLVTQGGTAVEDGMKVRVK